MKKSIYFLGVVLTAIIGSVLLSACSSDDPEPEPEPGYIFDVQISSPNYTFPRLELYWCYHHPKSLLFERMLEHNTSMFSFKADPSKNVNLKSIEFNYDTVYFSDIKDGVYTFECGAKLTMISNAEFSVTNLPKISKPDNWNNVARIHFDMRPSYIFYSDGSYNLDGYFTNITKTEIYDGENIPIDVVLIDTVIE